jgi:hypothetical protein
MATAIWGVLLYCARKASYAWDDFTVLGPLFKGGISVSLGRTVRPLEYFSAWLSLHAGAPVWLAVSCISYVATAIATVALFRRARLGTRETPPWVLFVCASSPVVALAYFQIDLVSQSLANFFCVLLALQCLDLLRRTERNAIRAGSWLLALTSIACLLSKETSYGIVFLAAALVLLRHRHLAAPPVVLVGALLVVVVLRSLSTNDLSAGSHYAPSPPWIWPFNLVFMTVVAIAPAPTSTTLTEALLGVPPLAVQVLIGVLAGVVLVVLAIPTVARLVRAFNGRVVREAIAAPWDNDGLLIALFAIFSTFPSIMIHVSEMYASQALPFLKVLMIAAMPAALPWRRFVAPTWALCALCWVLASATNLLFYNIITEYQPKLDPTLNSAERGAYGWIEAAVQHRRKPYSVYGWSDDMMPVRRGNCRVDTRFPHVCLPENITSGFPRRLGDTAP